MAREMDLQRLAARQHGLASRTQVLAHGFSRRQIDTRIASGRWRFAAPTVIDLAPASADPRRPLHAVVMASRGLASHASSAVLHGLVDEPPDRPQLIVAEGRFARGLEADVHRTRALTRADRTHVDAIACTSVLRTLLDLGSVVPEETLAIAVHRGLVSRRTTVTKLAKAIDRPMHGRRGVAPLRQVLEPYLVDQVRCESDLEVLLVRAIVRGELPPARWQHQVRVHGERFRLDVAWPRQRLFVEVDGLAPHLQRAQFVRDRRRQNLLVAAGWLPLRYTWLDLAHRPHEVVAEIARLLAART